MSVHNEILCTASNRKVGRAWEWG